MTVAFIPLRARGGRVVAVSLIDADLHDRLSGYSWHLNSSGYAVRTEHTKGGRRERKGRAVLLAREVMADHLAPGLVVDHISRDKMDNRRANLRVVTQAENLKNKDKTRCFNGLHLMTPENTRTPSPRTRRRCIACERERMARFRARQLDAPR